SMGNSATAGFRLSAQQERVWAQRAAGAAVCVVQIDGPVDRARLQDALRRLAARHEILRTVFHRQAGLKLPFQVIRESIEPQWKTQDLGHCNSSQRELDTLIQEAQQTPFDLETGPMLRSSLVRISADRHVLILSSPLLCTDIRSLTNL